jgi:docosahexaenoic acid omega-hydroxylase
MINTHPVISKKLISTFCIIDIRHPQHVQTILNSTNCLVRGELFNFPYTNGLIGSDDKMWHKHRKLLNSAFTSVKVSDYIPKINQRAKKLIEILQPHVDGKEFNVVRIMSALTMDSFMETSFGLQTEFLDNLQHPFFNMIKKLVYFILFNFKVF